MDRATVEGLVRHLLTAAGGYLVAKGVLDDGTLTEVIGGVVTVAGAVWSIWDKRKRVEG